MILASGYKNNEYIFAGNPHINDTNDLYGDFYAKISRKI